MAAKIKGLQQWCRKMTDGYPNVDIANFTTAWRNGMAFCAIIHRFRPDLIDFDSLSPDNVYENCKMAFEVAEKELNIPAFLEADDMARLKVPDKLSVITYVSQYYNFLNSSPQLGGPGVKGKVNNKRLQTADTSQAPSNKKSAPETSDDKKNISKARGSSGDKCTLCGNRVYLLERHMDGGKLYHRSCYRHSELSPTNKVYTRSPFLSPSLKSKTPPVSPTHLKHHPTTSASNQHSHQPSLVSTPNRHQGQTSSSAITLNQRTESVATGHMLAEPDREDKKKSKLESSTNDDSDKSHKANAIKDRLQNLKEKYEVAKKADSMSSEGKNKESNSITDNLNSVLKNPKPKTNNVCSHPSNTHFKSLPEKDEDSHSNFPFPLSGKESRKLEKRKEQLLSAERNADKSLRTAPRNVPLIFQQQEKDNGSKSASASVILSTSKNPQPSASSAVHSSLANTPVSSKSAISSHAGRKKVEMKPCEEAQTNKSDIDTLQNRFSSSEQNKAHPVAKTRSHKPSADTSNTPTAAPRKSLLMASTAVSEESPQNSARSSDTASPPPLPLSPPPPLPSTPPPSQTTVCVSQTTTTLVSGKLNSKLTNDKSHKPADKMLQTKDNKAITHGPVKAQVASGSSNTCVVSTSYHGNKRMSQPAVSSVSDSPQQGEKQVLTGLLASLAGVRGRAKSVPGITGLTAVNSESQSDDKLDDTEGASTLQNDKSIFDTNKAVKQSNDKHLDSSSITIRSDLKSILSKNTGGTQRTGELDISNVQVRRQTAGNILDVVSVSNSLSKPEEPPSIKPAKINIQLRRQTADNIPEALTVLNTLKKSEESTSVPLNVKKDKPLNSDTTKSVSSADNFKTKNELNNKKQTNLEFQTVKLKSVQSEAKQEYKTASHTASGSGLTSADSEHVPTKPPRVIRDASKFKPAASNSCELKSGGDNIHEQTVSVSEVKTPGKLSRANSYEEDGLPDWKLALEERKKKLKKEAGKLDLPSGDKVMMEAPGLSLQQNNNRAISPTDKTQTKDNVSNSSKFNKQSKLNVNGINLNVNKTDVKVKDSEIKKNVTNTEPVNKVFVEAKGKDSTPETNKAHLEINSGKKIIDRKGKHSKEGTDKIRPKQVSSGWKHDAEMKIAALGGFESDENAGDKKQNVEVAKTKRVLPKTPDFTNTDMKANKKHDIFTRDAKVDKNAPEDVVDSREKQDKKLNSHQNHQKETMADNMPQNKDDFRLRLQNLKPVPDNSADKLQRKTPSRPAPQLPKLHHINMMAGSDSNGNISHLSSKSSADNSKSSPRALDPPGKTDKKLVKPSDKQSNQRLPQSDKTENVKNLNNNNEKLTLIKLAETGKDMVDSNKKATESVSKPAVVLTPPVKIQSSIVTPDIKTVEGSETNKIVDSSDQRHSTPVHENNEDAPKPKRKLLLFGRKKKDKPTPSPVESPIHTRKKIEVPVQFDFDNSCDVETSLSDATASLSISDTHETTPNNMSHEKKTFSPGHISAIELQQQLLDIDSRLTDLELRGRDLEDSIRNVNISEEDDDSLMIKWFELVSEKNDLVRQEADLVYISREQDLETEQDHIESQLRYLMNKPDLSKSPAEKEEEDYLIHRKIELVEQRNRIVDSMDEDRLRYEEEDRDIEVTLRDKGLWKDSSGTLKAVKGKRVSNSTFYT